MFMYIFETVIDLAHLISASSHTFSTQYSSSNSSYDFTRNDMLNYFKV